MTYTHETDFNLVAHIQFQFAETGWMWQEQIFDNGDVSIRFTLNKWCHAMDINTNPNYSEDCVYGYGRFQRYDAWSMARAFLLLEYSMDKSATKDIERLREYKRKWNK